MYLRVFFNEDRAVRTKLNGLFSRLPQLVAWMHDQHDRRANFIDFEQLRVQIRTLAGFAALFLVDDQAHPYHSFSSTSSNCWKPNTTGVIVCRTAGALPGLIAENRSRKALRVSLVSARASGAPRQ